MLRRFSLYGFFKNQQYFEPFLVLVFLEKGLTFLSIGLLIAFRELVVNLFEILSGAVADVFGRRKSMITSFSSYIVSFVIFGLSSNLAWLFLAMFFFAIGEAFRTGTHKAMIFSWLKSQGRENEKTKVYGYTRSWSKIGSALSVVIATIFVLAFDRFTPIFYLAIIPYLLGIINFLGYPKFLDGTADDVTTWGDGVRKVATHTKNSIIFSAKKKELRRLMLESMGFDGLFRASKDYLQPILQAAAITLVAAFAFTDGLGEPQQAAILVGPVYFGLYILSAAASRNAHRIVEMFGDEESAARKIWLVALVLFVLLLPALYFEIHVAMIAGFILLYALQNTFRPVLIARIDDHGQEEKGATIMSIENQAKSLSTMLFAPLIGAAVDAVRARNLGGDFWPIGIAGVCVALVFFFKPAPQWKESTHE